MLAGHVKELEQHAAKTQIAALAQEINNELNINNIDRLADYLRLADDEKLTAEQKVALAFSGWILGSGSGTPSFTDAISLADARDAVRDYLRSTNQVERDEILKRLKYLEGRTLANVAKILATMKPPLDVEISQEGVWGLLERSIPGVGDEPEYRYLVQIPPGIRSVAPLSVHRDAARGRFHAAGPNRLVGRALESGEAAARRPGHAARLFRHRAVLGGRQPDASTTTRSANTRPCWGHCGMPVAISASTPIACS